MHFFKHSKNSYSRLRSFLFRAIRFSIFLNFSRSRGIITPAILNLCSDIWSSIFAFLGSIFSNLMICFGPLAPTGSWLFSSLLHSILKILYSSIEIWISCVWNSLIFLFKSIMNNSESKPVLFTDPSWFSFVISGCSLDNYILSYFSTSSLILLILFIIWLLFYNKS